MCHALVEDPEYLQAERARNRNRREPFDVLGLCLLSCDHGLLGGHAEQGAGVGLARRSVLSRADAVDSVLARPGRLDLSRIASAQSTSRAPDDGRPKLWRLLRHYLLRLRSTLRQHHFSSRFAAITFWLRRNHFGFGSIAIGDLRDRHACYRRRPAVARGRCPLSDGRRSNHDGSGKLLDGAPQPGDRPLAGGLAEGGA